MLSPGIPHTLAEAASRGARARAAGVPILSDAELLFQAVRGAGSRARFAGITGTNGKSTTTALLAHILAAAGVPVAAGGNLGTAALALPLLPDGGVYVLEMSSYMLERLATLRFDAAAMLNLSADHLDRHGDMARLCRGEARDLRPADGRTTSRWSASTMRCRAPWRPGSHARPGAGWSRFPAGRRRLADWRARTADRDLPLPRVARTTRRTPPPRRRWRGSSASPRGAIAAGIASYPGPAAPPAAGGDASTA